MKSGIIKSRGKKSTPGHGKNPTPGTMLPDSAAAHDDEIDPDALNRGDVPMTLVDHLQELRTRSLYCVAAIILLTAAGLYFSDEIIAFITDPITQFGHTLNIFKLAGGFILRIKVAFLSSLVISMPLIMFHIWRFIVPAVSIEARMFSRLSVLASALLFYTGVFFVFSLLLPYSLRILLRLIGSEYVSTIGADDYLAFLLYFCMSMGLLFQFPIAISLLTRIGIITPYSLKTRRKYSYVVIWIIAALITPQDLVAQIIVAIPLMVLYEASIIISRFVVIRQKKRELSHKNS